MASSRRAAPTPSAPVAACMDGILEGRPRTWCLYPSHNRALLFVLTCSCSCWRAEAGDGERRDMLRPWRHPRRICAIMNIKLCWRLMHEAQATALLLQHNGYYIDTTSSL